METALQQEQQDMLDERLASLGAYRSYYQGLPPPIIRCHSPIVRMCSSTSSSSTTMTTPRSSPQHWSMKSPFTSPTTTVATTNSSLASMGSASFLAPPLLSHGIVSPPKVVSVASSSNSSSTSFDAESSFDHVQGTSRFMESVTRVSPEHATIGLLTRHTS